jgi:hypothetical protein
VSYCKIVLSVYCGGCSCKDGEKWQSWLRLGAAAAAVQQQRGWVSGNALECPAVSPPESASKGLQYHSLQAFSAPADVAAAASTSPKSTALVFMAKSRTMGSASFKPTLSDELEVGAGRRDDGASVRFKLKPMLSRFLSGVRSQQRAAFYLLTLLPFRRYPALFRFGLWS